MSNFQGSTRSTQTLGLETLGKTKARMEKIEVVQKCRKPNMKECRFNQHIPVFETKKL